tara:strand:+ start:2722 stop:3567 length:846 start_codon:yes stop_codon:yes gene_type:complete
MNPRLKNIIFRKLNDELSKVEIILAENKSIWFINRANKYWYFELEKSGKLWWRYEFFTDFFIIFCLEVNEFQPILSEWVEGILNSGVSATQSQRLQVCVLVEGILNRGVSSTLMHGNNEIGKVEGVLNHGYRKGSRKVDEVLNHKVVTAEYCGIIPSYDLEEVLNREINEIDGGELFETGTVEKLLNPKITETKGSTILDTTHIHEALSRGFVSISPASEKIDFTQQVLVNDLLVKIESTTPLDTPAHDSVDEVLSYKVTRTIPDLNESLVDVERLLDSNQ